MGKFSEEQSCSPEFLPRDAMRKRGLFAVVRCPFVSLSVCLSVCLSLCLSRLSRIVSQWLKISSDFFLDLVAPSF